MQISDKAKKIFFPALMLVLNIFIFGTYIIYYGNASEFRFSYLNHILLLLTPTCAALIIIIIGFLLPQKIFNKFITIIFIIGLLLWVQRTFIVWNYGLLDGSLIKWDRIWWKGLIDISLWIFFIVIGLKFSSEILKYSSHISIGLIIVQLILMVITSINSHDNIWVKEYSPKFKPPEEIFQLSLKQNVFHIIFDGYQTDTLIDLINEEKYSKYLDGFVLYKENMAVATVTSYALAGHLFRGTI